MDKYVVFPQQAAELTQQRDVPSSPIALNDDSLGSTSRSCSSVSNSPLSQSDSLLSPTHSQNLAYRIKSLTESLFQSDRVEKTSPVLDAMSVESLTNTEKQIILQEFSEEIH